jgi:Phosphotransferase enzyme family
MSATDTAKMAWAAVRGGGQLLVDACQDLTGSSLPYRARDVVEPAVLASLINEGSLQPQSQPVRINRVERQNVPSVSSNCENLVLTIEQAGEPTLPRSLFVKLPMESLSMRWFFSIIKSWQLESYFFRSVARDLPLRTPVTYATRSRGTRFYLVQENLHEDPSVELFTSFAMLKGPSLEQVRMCLDAFARLHSVHFGLPPQERDRILPLRYHLFLSPAMRPVSYALNRFALDPCMKKHPGVIPLQLAEAYRLTIKHWDTLLAHWFSGPLSLLHGDSHLGNVFVTGDEIGMLDWQAAHWGKGIRDVHYFMTDSLPAATLAAHERELVDYYVQRRAHHGAPIAFEQTWEDYRSLSFQTLMTIIVAVGYGALNPEQDALMLEVLKRNVASAQRLDYCGWLHDFLSSR